MNDVNSYTLEAIFYLSDVLHKIIDAETQLPRKIILSECGPNIGPDIAIIAKIVLRILDELEEAMSKHPTWPDDEVHAAAIVCEESGELIRAALQHRYEYKSLHACDKEAVQTVATAIRFLMRC